MPQFFTNRDPNPTNIRIDTDTDAPAVTIIDWENAGASREGYDEARIYTYLALNDSLQEHLAERIDERPEEVGLYFWRTVIVRALREATSIKTGRYEALLGAANIDSPAHKTLKAKIVQRLVHAAQRGIDELA